MADLTSLRAALAAARARVTEQLYQATKAPSAAMSAALANARAAEVSARTALNAGIAAYVAGVRDCAESLQGDAPITLFPVRLETRFVAVATPVRPVTPPVILAARVRPGPVTDGSGGVVVDGGPARVPVGTLRVRIYPDDILARTHEPELTDDEWTAGRAYWAAGDSLSSWAALLAQYSAPRAAWIVSQTQTGQRPPARAASWTRPAEAILPDRFTVFAYRAGELVASASTGPVAEPLTLTIAPTIDAARQQAVAGGGPLIDRDLLWTLEYEEAKAAGMAVDLPVYAEDWANGYDLLLAVGVKGSFSVSDAAAAMKAIFDGHHYTNGLAFVPRGTPTSNAPGAASGYPSPDSGGAASFAVERGHPPAGDGTRWASWMGIDRSTVAHIAATGLNEDSAAQDMLTALWPATLGYHLEQMMAPAEPTLAAPFDASLIEAAYQYTRSNVRPGGPLPAFRVGSAPYGVLPVTSVGCFAGANRTLLAAALNALRPRLLAASQNAAAVRPASADPDGDLLSVLRLDATSHGFFVQPILGSELQNRLGTLPGLNLASALNAQDLQGEMAKAELASAGLPATNAPRIALASFGSASSFVGILVSSQADRDQPLAKASNYIDWIQNQLETGGTDLASGALPPGYESTLLFQLLRHAVLAEQARTANPGIRVIEISGLATIAPDATSPPLRRQPPAPSTAPLARLRPPTPAASPRLADIDAALGRLALLPVSQLERLIEETLDLCSHRFDAWMTSLATSSLRDERLAVSAAAPTPPSHFGAYGWVESLRPSATPFSPGPGGFIHAPSTNHAQTAAVLRNAYLSRSSAGATQYALDLSSARVRVGQSLLARIRDGESLGEILGAELEKRLRADPALSTSLDSIRTAFATPSSPMTDGLAAVLAWRKDPAAPPFTGALFAVLGEVSRLLDAAADLLTAEGVYQMVRGNPPGAAAALDALAQGVRPPDPEIAHVPVSGAAVTHRVAAVLTRTPPAGWPATLTPRAAAGQFVDEWVGTILGDPSRVRCRVAPAGGAPRIVTLAQLSLRPLDVVALAAVPPGHSSQDQEIDLRIRVAAGIPGGTITYEPDPAWPPTVVAFPAVMELARTVDRLISGARPLAASDLSLPSDGTVDVADPGVAARAQASLTALKALDLATPATLRAQLRAAALFGLTGAYPSDTATASELAALAARVEAERQMRIKEASSVTDREEMVRAVFGRRIPTVGRFTPPAAFQAALTSPPPLGAGANDALKWLQGASRVRPALDRWRRAWIYAEALGGAPLPLRVVQLPHSPTASWVALPFAPGGAPPSGTVSVVLAQPSVMATASAWAGLFIDEWSELIPSTSQQTGVAFNYVSPRAEAPLALLAAVPPAAAPTWSTDVLADIVRETFELTKMRLLTPDLLSSFSLLLPATSLQVNSAGDQLSTYFHGNVAGPIRVLPIAG